jgi:hypothetical protein
MLAADAAGYSRLIDADEGGTLTRLRRYGPSQLIRPSPHNGRLVKTPGDGLLIKLGSVVDALHYATEVQAGMAQRNATIAGDRRIESFGLASMSETLSSRASRQSRCLHHHMPGDLGPGGAATQQARRQRGQQCFPSAESSENVSGCDFYWIAALMHRRGAREARFVQGPLCRPDETGSLTSFSSALEAEIEARSSTRKSSCTAGAHHDDDE